MTSQQIKDWSQRLDRVTEAFHRLGSGMSEEHINLKPNPQEWSVSQVIEHLVAVNRSYQPIFDAVIAGDYRAPWTASLPFLPGWLGKMILKSVMPDNKRKTRTFPVWQPERGNANAMLFDEFRSSQEHLKEYLAKVEGKECVINSPASASIVYSLDDAFEIIVTHQERHLGQAQRVYEQIQISDL